MSVSPDEIVEVFRLDERAAADLDERQFAFLDQAAEGGGADAAELLPGLGDRQEVPRVFLVAPPAQIEILLRPPGRSIIRTGGDGVGRSRSTASWTASLMRSRSAWASRSGASLIAAVADRRCVGMCCVLTTPKRETTCKAPYCRA
jgi:hypothetical protein